MILTNKNLNIAKRKFIDEYLIKDSLAKDRIKYWTDIGYNPNTAYRIITECNSQFAEEYQDCVSGKYTKQIIIQLLEETLERNKGKNDKIYLQTLENISKINGMYKDNTDINVILPKLQVELLTKPDPIFFNNNSNNISGSI